MSSAIIDYAYLSAGGRTVKKLTTTPYSSTQCNLYGICSMVEKGHSLVVALIEGLEPSQS